MWGMYPLYPLYPLWQICPLWRICNPPLLRSGFAIRKGLVYGLC